MSKTSKRVSKAPTATAATTAAEVPETNAVAVVNDGAATPPGFSVPGGTNTASESGVAVGEASTDPVKPHGKDGTSTPVTVTDATNDQPAPEAEAAASGGSVLNIEPSQGDAASGAGNPAGPTDLLGARGLDLGAAVAPVIMGMDLATGPDVGAISWGDRLVALSDTHPNIYRFLARFLDEEPDTMPTALIVKAKTAGFRRCGIVHSTEGLTFSAGDYTVEQLEAWLGEPELTVEIV